MAVYRSTLDDGSTKYWTSYEVNATRIINAPVVIPVENNFIAPDCESALVRALNFAFELGRGRKRQEEVEEDNARIFAVPLFNGDIAYTESLRDAERTHSPADGPLRALFVPKNRGELRVLLDQEATKAWSGGVLWAKREGK